MMTIMRKTAPINRLAAKQESHARIVKVAARAIRQSGYNGTGVADIMKEAGLTHGAFYAHFESREAMLVEALDSAFDESNNLAQRAIVGAPVGQSLSAVINAYLSESHQIGIETGCPLTALCSEMPRQSQELRRVSTRRIQDMVHLVAQQLPDSTPSVNNERALVTVATMVGTLMLARAVDDPSFANALRLAAIKSLSADKTA